MAKRLYPYVTKIYEVSENGTLLVAEYIQPFESYQEMCKYSEKIKDILEKLSSVYLIGDVGITPKNYSNWGLRIGSEDPVCLDFAYVYEVRSELFICRHCKANAMLIPTKDFTKLQCSNPTCGKIYLFEDIRAKIGNDLHRHEIGDLTEEGYALSESEVPTELTEERSNYLKRKETKVEKKEKKPSQEDFVPDNFVMEHSPKYYIQHEEEQSMSIERLMGVADSLNRNNPDAIPILKGRIIKATPDHQEVAKGTPVIQAKVIELVQSGPVMQPTPGVMGGGLAFEGTMGDEGYEEPVKVPEPPVIPAEHIELTVEMKPAQESLFKKSFIDRAERAVSQISNYLQITLHMNEVFDRVKDSVKEKMWPDAFYRNIQNAVYHSLLTFCNFTQSEIPTSSGGTKKIYKLPEDIEGQIFTPTLLFIQKYWMNRDINEIEDLDDMKAAYQRIYGENPGFQKEWLKEFKNRLSRKGGMKIDAYGIDLIVQIIDQMWCAGNEVETEVESASQPEPVKEEIPNPTPDPLEGEFHAGDLSANVLQGPGAEEDEEVGDQEEDDEDEDDNPDYISVNIVHDDGFDVVKISCDDPFGFTSIPIYCNLNEVESKNPPSLSDERNGMWDWLIHMSPDLTFTTTNPDRWLKLANNGELYEGQIHMCILDEENGVYLMGVYILNGVYEFDEEDEPVLNLSTDLLLKLNNLICNNIGLSKISHYTRSVSMREDAKSESYIETVMKFQSDDSEEEGEDGNMELTAAEKAALQVMMGTDDGAETKPSQTTLKQAASQMANDIMKGADNDVKGDQEESGQETAEESDEEEAVVIQQKEEEPKKVSESAPASSGQGLILKPVRRADVD
ncbi:MAG: hypothetical protein NC489_24345 [Ruminococcus flavefaciens]|nr:hypothetical protein [Ruminococcus flavefaciens]